MTVVYKLWEKSWDDDAVELDRAGGVFENLDKVHPIHHDGRFSRLTASTWRSPHHRRRRSSSRQAHRRVGAVSRPSTARDCS